MLFLSFVPILLGEIMTKFWAKKIVGSLPVYQTSWHVLCGSFLRLMKMASCADTSLHSIDAYKVRKNHVETRHNLGIGWNMLCLVKSMGIVAHCTFLDLLGIDNIRHFLLLSHLEGFTMASHFFVRHVRCSRDRGPSNLTTFHRNLHHFTWLCKRGFK